MFHLKAVVSRNRDLFVGVFGTLAGWNPADATGADGPCRHGNPGQFERLGQRHTAEAGQVPTGHVVSTRLLARA